MSTSRKIQDATFAAKYGVKNILDTAKKISDDKQQKVRLERQECVLCFYRGRIVAHAFTEYTCEDCGDVGSWPNSGRPRLCKECAQGHSACMHCMAEISFQETK